MASQQSTVDYIVEQMAASIRALKAEGLSVLLCEQNLHLSQAVAAERLTALSGFAPACLPATISQALLIFFSWDEMRSGRGVASNR